PLGSVLADRPDSDASVGNLERASVADVSVTDAFDDRPFLRVPDDDRVELVGAVSARGVASAADETAPVDVRLVVGLDRVPLLMQSEGHGAAGAELDEVEVLGGAREGALAGCSGGVDGAGHHRDTSLGEGLLEEQAEPQVLLLVDGDD